MTEADTAHKDPTTIPPTPITIPPTRTAEELLAENAKLRDDNLKLGKFAVRVRHHLLDLRLPDSLRNSLLIAGFLAEADEAVRIDRKALVALDEDEELKRLRAERAGAAAEETRRMADLSALRAKAEVAIMHARGREQEALDRLASIQTIVQTLHDRLLVIAPALAEITGELLEQLAATRTCAAFYTVEPDMRVYGSDQPDLPAHYVLKGRKAGIRHLYLASMFVSGDRVRWCPTAKQRDAFRCQEGTARHLARLLHARVVRLRAATPTAATSS